MDKQGREAQTAEDFADVMMRVARAAGVSEASLRKFSVERNPQADARFDLAQIRHNGALKFSARAVKAALGRMLPAVVN